MTNPQGTAWETDIVRRAEAQGLGARRLVKQSQKDEADVLIEGLSGDLPALFWKRIVKRGGKNRSPLGERYVVVLTVDDFLDLLARVDSYGLAPRVWVQAKWAEQISVTKVLGGLRNWLDAKLAS